RKQQNLHSMLILPTNRIAPSLFALYVKKTITTNNVHIAMIKKSPSDINNKPHNNNRSDTYE
ncbi:hypothetical protein, partial [Escherichia coli]|uniref:hypothetical protein n=1 Tax=Escherichia coli TaxID=562 RepID=UPI001BC8422F